MHQKWVGIFCTKADRIGQPTGDIGLSRLLDALISIPSKLFGLVVVAAFGSSIPVLISTLAIIYLPGCYRIVRSVAVNVAGSGFESVNTEPVSGFVGT